MLREGSYCIIKTAKEKTIKKMKSALLRSTCRGHVDSDVTASQPLDDLVAVRHDLDVNLVRVLVGARLARPDVLHAGAAVLHSDRQIVCRILEPDWSICVTW